MEAGFMRFVVYTNYTNQRSRIHREDCGRYQRRKQPDDRGTGRWEGPFDGWESALGVVPAYQQDLDTCSRCLRNVPIPEAWLANRR